MHSCLKPIAAAFVACAPTATLAQTAQSSWEKPTVFIMGKDSIREGIFIGDQIRWSAFISEISQPQLFAFRLKIHKSVDPAKFITCTIAPNNSTYGDPSSNLTVYIRTRWGRNTLPLTAADYNQAQHIADAIAKLEPQRIKSRSAFTANCPTPG